MMMQTSTYNGGHPLFYLSFEQLACVKGCKSYNYSYLVIEILDLVYSYCKHVYRTSSPHQFELVRARDRLQLVGSYSRLPSLTLS